MRTIHKSPLQQCIPPESAIRHTHVVIGTRFIATPEAQAAQGYREAIVRAHEDSTLRTRAYTGKTCRVIRTEYALEWEKDPSKIQPFPLQAQTSSRNGVMNYTGHPSR